MRGEVCFTHVRRQGQVATDAELQCLKVARLLRDVCGSRRPEPAHRHSPLAAGILSLRRAKALLLRAASIKMLAVNTLATCRNASFRRPVPAALPAIHLHGGSTPRVLLWLFRCAGEAFWPHLPRPYLSWACRTDIGWAGELQEQPPTVNFAHTRVTEVCLRSWILLYMLKCVFSQDNRHLQL